MVAAPELARRTSSRPTKIVFVAVRRDLHQHEAALVAAAVFHVRVHVDVLQRARLRARTRRHRGTAKLGRDHRIALRRRPVEIASSVRSHKTCARRPPAPPGSPRRFAERVEQALARHRIAIPAVVPEAAVVRAQRSAVWVDCAIGVCCAMMFQRACDDAKPVCQPRFLLAARASCAPGRAASRSRAQHGAGAAASRRLAGVDGAVLAVVQHVQARQPAPVVALVDAQARRSARRAAAPGAAACVRRTPGRPPRGASRNRRSSRSSRSPA